MRQGNGSDLLGVNNPRNASIGVIYVNPNDDRESILAAILIQEKLGRKQIAIVLPDQNKAFHRPIDFEGLKNMRRKLQAQLIIVAPQGSAPAEFARQRRFTFFSSLESYGRSLRDESEASRSSKRGWLGGRRTPRPSADAGANSNEMVPPPPMGALQNALPPNDPLHNIDDDDVEFAPSPPTYKRVDSIVEQFGPYNIVRLLGQGDMGKVYFAEDSIQQPDGTWHKRSVAVKVLHKWYDKDMFRSHVQKMTKLQHANLLSTLLFGVKDDAPYLVMQYASQGTLRDRHPRGNIFPIETILSYVKQIASALQYAHERDMFGDVRPKKMFVGTNNTILVSGFDIALNVGADPGRMVAKDYFEYRAPEQTQAFSSAACNQYALGIMVYEWLCGSVPFQGESVQIVYQHKKVTPPSLREQNTSIPHEVEEVVMKALAKDPEKRYESIQEFAEALEEAIHPPEVDRFMLPDRSGEQFGQYRLERLLGIGGFAEVYLGKHVKLDTFAAIKVLHTRMSAKEVEAFEKEAKVIASLRHPSIVRVLDYDAKGNIPFLVMDHAPEGTMRQFHSRGSRLSLPTVVKYIKQTAEALQFAHNKKIIHRDVKPENMLIESQGTIMLSDFGLAVIAHSSRSARQQDKAGTAQYMAPEQFRGKAVPASDQYSLAVTAYEWLCGAPPFDEGDEIQLGFQHTMEPVPKMSERGAVVLEEVERVILKALAKEPTERFVSVKEFAEALEKAAQVD